MIKWFKSARRGFFCKHPPMPETNTREEWERWLDRKTRYREDTDNANKLETIFCFGVILVGAIAILVLVDFP